MDINEEIKSEMPQIMARIKSEAISRIEREAVNAATEVAIKAAKDWAIENLVPEIKAQLEAGKGSMVKAAADAAEAVGEAVSKALVAQAVKNLASSYQIQNVVKAIFG